MNLFKIKRMKTTKHKTTKTAEPIKPGYKKTKVGVIPEDWEIKRLGEVCGNICGEYGANESAISYSKDLPRYVRITDINDNGSLSQEKVSADLTKEEIDKYRLKYGDLLFARTGATVGKSYLHLDTKEEMVYAGFLIRFNFDLNQVNPIIIKEITNTNYYWNWVKAFSARSGQPGLNSKELSSLHLPIPPLPEQKAIADCLTTWDRAIEKQKKLIAAKKLQKKGLMQQIFNGQLKVENGELVKVEDKENWLKGWKEVRLGDISIKKTSNIQSGLLIENSGKYNVYGASGFITKIDIYDEEKPYIGIVKDGSGVGNTFLLEGKSSVLSTLDKILPKKNSNLVFLYSLIKKLNFEKYKVGGAIPHIYYKDYSKEKVLIPSLEEQTAIAEILQTADKEIELLEKQLTQLELQKKGLMQVLLTGEKRLVES